MRDGWQWARSVWWWKGYATRAERVLWLRTAESGLLVFPLGAQLYHFTLSIFVLSAACPPLQLLSLTSNENGWASWGVDLRCAQRCRVFPSRTHAPKHPAWKHTVYILRMYLKCEYTGVSGWFIDNRCWWPWRCNHSLYESKEGANK